MTTPKQEAHTPTPWTVHHKRGYRYWLFGPSADGIGIMYSDNATAKANAAFIVRAVNSHNDLLIVAKECLCYLDPDCKLDGVSPQKGMSDRTLIIIGLYEAIAKAEGRE